MEGPTNYECTRLAIPFNDENVVANGEGPTNQESTRPVTPFVNENLLLWMGKDQKNRNLHE